MTNTQAQQEGWRRKAALALPYVTLVAYVAVVTAGSFMGGLWASAGIAAALLLCLGTVVINRRMPRPSAELLMLAVVTLIVAAILNLHSVNPALSWFDWTRLVTIFLPLVLLTSPDVQMRADHEHLLSAVLIAAFCGVFALAIELILGAPVLHLSKGDHIGLTQYNRGLSYMVVLSMPLIAALWIRPLPPATARWRGWLERSVPLALFMAAILLTTSLTESRASKLALMLALATVALAFFLPRLVHSCLKALVALLLFWPFIVQKCFLLYQGHLAALPDSWRNRVEIWDYMSYRIAERPWLGWGLGASKILDFSNPNGGLYKFVTAPAPHPHNVVTQLWVELGLPGLMIGAFFALVTLKKASRLAPTLVPFAYGAWVAALCLSLVAYNFWTDSMFAAFALTAFAFSLLNRRLLSKC